jgi:hypothetical protein
MLQRDRFKGKMPLHEKLNLLLNAFMALVYVITGIVCFSYRNLIANGMGTILTVLLVLYGIFRGFRVYQKYEEFKRFKQN